MTVYAESLQNQRLYCQRGEMENRIKECQLDLFTDRMSNYILRATNSACGSPP